MDGFTVEVGRKAEDLQIYVVIIWGSSSYSGIRRDKQKHWLFCIKGLRVKYELKDFWDELKINIKPFFKKHTTV